jgi:hypothetical protein
MEKRRSKRVALRLGSWTTLGDISFSSFIENFSKEGILITIQNCKVPDFYVGERLTIDFQIPSGLECSLTCVLIWTRIKSNIPFGLNFTIGMQIINPPQEYIEFVENLYEEIIKLLTLFNTFRVL